MAKKAEKTELELCLEYRKGLELKPDLDMRIFHCDKQVNNALKCWEKCPVPSRMKDGQAKLPIVEKIHEIGKAVAGINTDVYEEIKPDKKPKKMSIDDFLMIQSRVFSKLAWKPEIWQALDNLSTQEILDRLVGKTGLEGVPTMMGGKAVFEASKATHKMFADLEQKLAGEGDEPYAVTEEPPDDMWLGWGNSHRPALPKGYLKTLRGDKEKLKICQEWRKSRGMSPEDFRTITCEYCLSFNGCPIWAKKEEKENGKKST